MSTALTDDDLPAYAYHHSRTERALFHAAHVRRLLELAGLPIPPRFKTSNGFHAVHEDEMDPILEAIKKRARRPKLTLIQGGR